ncbi:MAG TPA: helix-turn-helix domain-containing protein [Solirubrobacter sp.]|nr:helix-turn-helix domain-containing protein [Solirubrobacter sp.]
MDGLRKHTSACANARPANGEEKWSGHQGPDAPQRIRKFRRSSGMSRDEVARRLGVRKKFYVAMEAGVEPVEPFADALADLFGGVNVDYLLDRRELMPASYEGLMTAEEWAADRATSDAAHEVREEIAELLESLIDDSDHSKAEVDATFADLDRLVGKLRALRPRLLATQARRSAYEEGWRRRLAALGLDSDEVPA